MPLMQNSETCKKYKFRYFILYLYPIENYTNRKEYISKLLSYKDKDLIKVVSGLLRSGKSTLLELYREQLFRTGIGKRQIHFYNFELPENFVGKNWDDIYFDIKKKL